MTGDQRRSTRPGTLGRGRRLGPMEYTLLALIAVAIAITVAMAVFDPAT